MSVPLPDTAKTWLDSKVFATVATIGTDGQPQLSVVWVKHDGDDVLFSTTTNRQKYRNLVRDPRATISVFNPDVPYQYLEVRGGIVFEDEGSMALIDEFAKKYQDWDRYPADDGTDNVRITVRIKPQKVVFNG